ncbi:hypothetical protein [Antribacter gilvus]|uniref:hypothetical protein n=1 Tax=Antribacter gilvus TaxID=2304675 RepID=UPI0013DFED25|nr:hypothetical protein [Antribacter gilvus]
MKRSVAPSPQVARLSARPVGRLRRWSTVSAALLASVLAVALPAAPAAAEDRILEVTADGVRFVSDNQRVDITYTVFDSNFNWLANYRDSVPGSGRNEMFVAFDEAKSDYPDGYCVTNVWVEDAGSWQGWAQHAKCFKPEKEESQPTPTPAPPAPAPAPPAPPAPEPPAPAPAPTKAAPKPAPAPSPAPSDTPSPTPSDTPTPSATPSASPSPSLKSPLAGAHADKNPPPPVPADDDPIAAGLGWIAVLFSGLLVSAGGWLLIARVRGQ